MIAQLHATQFRSTQWRCKNSNRRALWRDELSKSVRSRRWFLTCRIVPSRTDREIGKRSPAFANIFPSPCGPEDSERVPSARAQPRAVPDFPNARAEHFSRRIQRVWRVVAKRRVHANISERLRFAEHNLA